MQGLLLERMVSSGEASSSAFSQAQSAQQMPRQRAMGSIPPSCMPTKGRFQRAAGHCSKKQRLCYCRAQITDPDSPPEYIVSCMGCCAQLLPVFSFASCVLTTLLGA